MSATSHVIQRTAAVSQWAKSELIHLFRFVQQPNCRQQYVTDPHWVLRAVYLSLLVIILVAPLAFLINTFQEFLGIAESLPTTTSNVTTFVSVVFFAPLLEEALFRAGLRNPICSLILAPVVTMAFLINSEERLLIFSIFLATIALITISHRSLFFGSSKAQLEKMHSQKFKTIFWANCFYFSCAHLNNFELSGMQIALFWLLVAPQLLFAVIFSYLRLRSGIKSAILSHATINIVGLSAYTF